MSIIICVHRVFLNLCYCGNVGSVQKTLIISDSCISYFGHVCLKLNLLLISRLTVKCATQNLKNLRNSSLWIC